MKTLTVVGTRPEIIKLSRTINLLDKYTDHTLVHTGQNHDYELNQVFFEDLNVRQPDHFLSAAEPTPAATIARVIERVDPILEQVSPDSMLIYGDTNSCLSVIAAKRRRIPVFHCEAGNRCFDERVPEEINRRLVDHLSDINMPLTEHARRYLEREGIRPETIVKTGSPMKEVLDHHNSAIAASDVEHQLGVTAGKYVIASIHREENVDNAAKLACLIDTLDAVAETYKCAVLVSTHPRTRKRLSEFDIQPTSENVQLLKPLGFFDYNKLQTGALCVLSDSGTLSEESSILGFPGVMIRQAHERPEGMDLGVSIMAGLERATVLKAIDVTVDQHSQLRKVRPIVDDYSRPLFSSIVTRAILSYSDYIKRTVWREY